MVHSVYHTVVQFTFNICDEMIRSMFLIYVMAERGDLFTPVDLIFLPLLPTTVFNNTSCHFHENCKGFTEVKFQSGVSY